MYTDNGSILKKDRYSRTTEEIYYTKCNIFKNYLYIYVLQSCYFCIQIFKFREQNILIHS